MRSKVFKPRTNVIGVNRSHPLADGLIAAWAMDDNKAQITDLMGEYHLTTYGTIPTSKTQYGVGRGPFEAGNTNYNQFQDTRDQYGPLEGYRNIPSAQGTVFDRSPHKPFAVCAIVKTSSTWGYNVGTPALRSILTRIETGSILWSAYEYKQRLYFGFIDDGAGSIRLQSARQSQAGDGSSLTNQTVVGSYAAPDDKVHVCILNYQYPRLSLYLDGLCVGEESTPTDLHTGDGWNANHIVCIGMQPTSATDNVRPYENTMYDVRYWKRSLSNSEISNLAVDPYAMYYVGRNNSVYRNASSGPLYSWIPLLRRTM